MNWLAVVILVALVAFIIYEALSLVRTISNHRKEKKRKEEEAKENVGADDEKGEVEK